MADDQASDQALVAQNIAQFTEDASTAPNFDGTSENLINLILGQDILQQMNQGDLDDQRSDQLGNQIEEISRQIGSVT